MSPCDDFYRYACGGWMGRTEIPSDRARWSRGFDRVTEQNEGTLKELLDGLSREGTGGKSPYASTLAALYTGCMDEPQAERALPKARAEIRGLLETGSPAALARTLAKLHSLGVQALFSFRSSQDPGDAMRMIGQLEQPTLSLPDRDYYLSDAKDKRAARDELKRHLSSAFQMWGMPPSSAATAAATVIRLEARLAKASMSRVDLRDPKKTYHRLDLAGLKRAAPAFPWEQYLHEAGAPGVDAVNVQVPAFVAEVSAMVRDVPAGDWRTYLTWRYIDSRTLALPRAFGDEDFRFQSQTLTGTKADAPRWLKCVRLSDALMGEALGVPFVQKTFGADGKVKAQEIVRSIEAAFEKEIASIGWMDGATRAKALAKLKKISPFVGYPDVWRRYDSLEADRKDFLSALSHAHAFEWARVLTKIGKPVDRSEWEMTPPTVNAYYEPLVNEIFFPAGILQPPFFDRSATYPVNFGSIGMVVGHELTHGFDDEGAQYDGDGNLKNWWTDASKAAFERRTRCVETQLDSYVGIDGIHVNGALTLGETVADLGGLKLAHAAMEDWLEAHPQPDSAYRFTPEQQFFLGFAQGWCEKQRPEKERVSLTVNPHPPARFRVNGAVRNLAAFAKAFSCPAGAKMAPAEQQRCEVW